MSKFASWYWDRTLNELYGELNYSRNLDTKILKEMKRMYNEGLMDWISAPFDFIWKGIKTLGTVVFIGGLVFLAAKYGIRIEWIKNLFPKSMQNWIEKAIASVENKGLEFLKMAGEKLYSVMPQGVQKFMSSLKGAGENANKVAGAAGDVIDVASKTIGKGAEGISGTIGLGKDIINARNSGAMANKASASMTADVEKALQQVSKNDPEDFRKASRDLGMDLHRRNAESKATEYDWKSPVQSAIRYWTQ